MKGKILKNLKNTYCRLRCSKINGVGVFAIRDIQKNVNPFRTMQKQKWYKFNISDMKHLDRNILKMMDDFYVVEKNGDVLIPGCCLNGMDISFFINNSNKPNIKTVDGGFNFITLRKIKKGEELTVSYSAYDYKYKK